MSEQRSHPAKVVFTPSGLRAEIAGGDDILSAARALGVDLDSVCGGHGVCGRCKVRIAQGAFPKYQIDSSREHLSPVTGAEREILSPAQLAAGFRLGCRARLRGDAIIDIPPESQRFEQVVRKTAGEISLDTSPAVELVTLEVAEARLDHPSGDLERLRDALEFTTGYTDLAFDLPVLQQLQVALRKGNWTVSVAIYQHARVIALWPGERRAVYGLAIDIGSTTLAAHLCELASARVLATAGLMNPQIRFGEDLMSRVSYAMMHPGGEREMTAAVREGINRLVDQLLSEADVARDRLLDMVLVGNPVMHHLLLGINPVELGGAPFALATQSGINLPAREIGIELAEGARSYLLPCIAGHVGADAAAVILSEAPYKREEITLIIDVGTNAEIILGNRARLVAASAPTGPAFEGAQISHGQRAAPGAIERVRIDPETLEPRYRVIGVEPWSDQPGFGEAVRKTGITGICGSGIIEAIVELFLAGVIRSDGVIDGRKAAINPRIAEDGKTFCYRLVEAPWEINIRQTDVRAIQLAKATLYASARLLMDKLGIDRIERIRLAGGFGAVIEPRYAMALGMIPDCPLEQVRAVGNAAGSGARIALASLAARAEIEQAVLGLEKIETATEASFQDYFVAAMAIPHKHDSFDQLAKVLPLPKQQGDGGQSGRKRRRRSRK